MVCYGLVVQKSLFEQKFGSFVLVANLMKFVGWFHNRVVKFLSLRLEPIFDKLELERVATGRAGERQNERVWIL